MFILHWIWEKISGASKITTQPKVVDQAGLDNEVGKKVVRNRRAVPAKKGNPVAKPAGVRSNNKSKTSGKSAGKAVRPAAPKSKSKSKAV